MKYFDFTTRKTTWQHETNNVLLKFEILTTLNCKRVTANCTMPSLRVSKKHLMQKVPTVLAIASQITSGLFTWKEGTQGRWGNGVTRLSIIWSRLHDRWGDPPHVTSPIWGPPPQCEQALTTYQASLSQIVNRCSLKHLKCPVSWDPCFYPKIPASKQYTSLQLKRSFIRLFNFTQDRTFVTESLEKIIKGTTNSLTVC